MEVPPSHPPIITHIDEGSPAKEDDDLPAPKLTITIFEVFITPAAQQVIQSTPGGPMKEKGKRIAFGLISPMKSLKKF